MRFPQASVPQLALWLVLAWPEMHSALTNWENASRRKRLHPTARPRRLVDWALQRSAAEHAAQQASQLHLHQPLQFTVVLRLVDGAPRRTEDCLCHFLPWLYTTQTHCALEPRPVCYTSTADHRCRHLLGSYTS